ncbi:MULTISPECIES: hypothetical protein [unclassified Mesorhizobium]|uniref:hypothetical protein n=1 Tax=unclassified Mesorhizobium TaxID=325217 RepID=UPI0033362072
MAFPFVESVDQVVESGLEQGRLTGYSDSVFDADRTMAIAEASQLRHSRAKQARSAVAERPEDDEGAEAFANWRRMRTLKHRPET